MSSYALIFALILSMMINSSEIDLMDALFSVKDEDWKILRCTGCAKVPELNKALDDINLCFKNEASFKELNEKLAEIKIKQASDPDQCGKEYKEVTQKSLKGKDKATMDKLMACLQPSLSLFQKEYLKCK